jgi:hypothetical protein
MICCSFIIHEGQDERSIRTRSETESVKRLSSRVPGMIYQFVWSGSRPGSGLFRKTIAEISKNNGLRYAANNAFP